MKSCMLVLLIFAVLVPLAATDRLAELIMAYELEKWGYLEMEWNLGSMYDNSKSKEIESPTDVYSSSDRLLSHSLDIEMHRHTESEQRYSDITVHPTGSWSKNISHSKYMDSSYLYGTDTRTYRAASVIGFKNREYRPGSDVFFASNLQSFIGWYGNKRVNHTNYSDEDYRTECNNNSVYNMDNELGLGLGIGRMREVTNVVRAQRMAQRLQSINGTVLTDEQILRLARWLEKQTAYRAAYNRSDNASDYYFWQSALSDIGLEDINFDQFLYFTQEARGGTILARNEGMLFEMGAIGAIGGGKDNDAYKYVNGENKHDDFSSTKVITTGGGFYLNFESARNVSGTSQITFTVPLELLFLHSEVTQTGDDDEYYYRGETTSDTDYTEFLFQPGMEYLVQVTDRLGVTWHLAFLVHSKAWESDITDRYTGLTSGCECTYYLGNNVRLVWQGYYERLDYHNDDVLDNGLELSRDWGFGLELQWRPVHKML